MEYNKENVDKFIDKMRDKLAIEKNKVAYEHNVKIEENLLYLRNEFNMPVIRVNDKFFIGGLEIELSKELGYFYIYIPENKLFPKAYLKPSNLIYYVDTYPSVKNRIDSSPIQAIVGEFQSLGLSIEKSIEATDPGMGNEVTISGKRLRQFLSICKDQAIEEANKRKKEAFDELKKEFPEIRAELPSTFPLGECKFWLGNAQINVFKCKNSFFEFPAGPRQRVGFYKKSDLGRFLDKELEAYILGE